MKILVRQLDNGRVLVRNLDSNDFRVLPLESAMDYVKELLEGGFQAETEE